MVRKYLVDLKEAEQTMLNELIKSGTQRVRRLNHARLLLKASEGWSDQQISDALDVSIRTIERARQRFVEEGLELALSPRRTRRKYQNLIDGIQEAHLIALACGQPPVGHRRWSLRLLASEMVRMDYIDDVSHETVRHVMQENELKPWLKKEWCIPPQQNAEFVYHMEDVLEVYQRPAYPRFPLV